MSDEKISQNRQLQEIFGEFVGMEMETNKKYPTEEATLKYFDVIAAGKEHGIDVRIHLPVSGSRTGEGSRTMLNLMVEEDKSGRWILQDKYYIG